MADRHVRQTSGQIETACNFCGRALYLFPAVMDESPRHFCDRACLGKWRSQQRGPAAAHWQGGETTVRGRVYWHLPWHQRADEQGYVARAIIVAELSLGRPVSRTEVVHHRDKNTSNDHPDNLEVLENQAAHARLHGLQSSPEHMARMAAMRAARRTA